GSVSALRHCADDEENAADVAVSREARAVLRRPSRVAEHPATLKGCDTIEHGPSPQASIVAQAFKVDRGASLQACPGAPIFRRDSSSLLISTGKSAVPSSR